MIATQQTRKTVVVIGNGMVGHRFCERVAAYDTNHEFEVVTFCEEPRPAYDRVNLTKYFERRNALELKLACPNWYAENGIALHVGDRATAIDRDRRVVLSKQGREVEYDAVVMATGSAPIRAGSSRRREEGLRLPGRSKTSSRSLRMRACHLRWR